MKDKKINQLQKELVELHQRIIELEAERKQAEETMGLRMRELSPTDELTGLFNRRHFDEVFEIEIYRSQCYGGPFSLIMAELDGFKEYIEKFGETNGASVLRAFAQTLKAGLRKTDVACRYSDDEFSVILPSTGVDRASNAIDSIRSKFSQMLETEHTSGKHLVGLSAGIAEFPQVAATADSLVCMAECALYYAKMRGGNRSVLISDLEIQLTKDAKIERPHELYDIAEYIEAKDPSAYGHSENVTIISELIDKAMWLLTLPRN